MSFQSRLLRPAIDLQADQGITRYPVRAAAVRAYLGAGNAGVSIIGIMDFEPIISEPGAVGIDDVRAVLSTHESVAAGIVAREHSVGFKGVLYDVVRKIPANPSTVDCHLRELS